MMNELQQTSTIFGGNMPYIEEQYENYLANPSSVDAKWRDYFDAMRAGATDVAHQPVIDAFAAMAKSRKAATASIDATLMDKQLGVVKLIHAYRFVGGRIADIDPLKRQDIPFIKELDHKHYGLTDSDMETEFSTGNLTVNGGSRAKLKDILATLKTTYCRSVSVEYMYMTN
ncbi:MAG: 2-oxoglutarate dehydrogenase E1 component, partial [Burkholderiales bacterium]